jgi:hypothetical protein
MTTKGPRQLLPADAGGPLYRDRGEPTAADLDNMAWSGVREWTRYEQRREMTAEEKEDRIWSGR